eukprot:TRINITY_DN51694_c0_g1_i1.p2 TRINITY_DN51694_c0_g1~~TRINITY_DN51694_c0_g1_i1.p2  ORF type:complete len:297 (-),score=32.32 TRINITY_DN51694_c0_g1_i1:1725-2579(-)
MSGQCKAVIRPSKRTPGEKRRKHRVATPEEKQVKRQKRNTAINKEYLNLQRDARAYVDVDIDVDALCRTAASTPVHTPSPNSTILTSASTPTPPSCTSRRLTTLEADFAVFYRNTPQPTTNPASPTVVSTQRSRGVLARPKSSRNRKLTDIFQVRNTLPKKKKTVTKTGQNTQLQQPSSPSSSEGNAVGYEPKWKRANNQIAPSGASQQLPVKQTAVLAKNGAPKLQMGEPTRESTAATGIMHTIIAEMLDCPRHLTVEQVKQVKSLSSKWYNLVCCGSFPGPA